MYLEKIQSPKDLKGLKPGEMNILAEEIRQELVTTVSRNGGHLASNLGAVELTLAIHRVFDLPEDKLIFDVGHQSYVHKMVTGRFDRFHTLREYGGIAGFPRRSESEYDCFETGHASTAISAALGLARARDYQGGQNHVIALVGDGALTGGMCYEALNDAGHSGTRMLVILNDNEMSIAPNVGALSRYLTRLRVSAGWQRAKRRVRNLSDVPGLGRPMYRVIHGTKKGLKSMLVRETDIGFFEALGFDYYGPIDGHDLAGLERALRLVKSFRGPCVLHVLTQKGHGYDQAEERPETFHGTPPFYIENGDRIELPENPSCGHVMADTLSEMLEKDKRIVAITAAMKLGTGLDHLAAKYPDRVLDVGIAEEHAATMTAGLAAGGMRPYFAVYSSFFQRCYDQMIHDVAMQNLPVVFLLDRSGIGGEDGQTHHGVFDFAELLPVPNMTVLAPCDARELKRMLLWTLSADGPVAIRYGKSGTPLTGSGEALLPQPEAFTPGRWNLLAEGEDLSLLAAGGMVRQALKVRKLLAAKGLRAAVWNCSSLKPLDGKALERIARSGPVFTMEEHMLQGGFGQAVTAACREKGRPEPVYSFAIRDRFIAHGAHDLLLRDAGLDPATVAEEIEKTVGKAADGK